MIKYKIVVGVEDIATVRLQCTKCKEIAYLTPNGPLPAGKPGCCQAIWVQKNDPAIQLLGLIGSKLSTSAFAVSLEFDEPSTK